MTELAECGMLGNVLSHTSRVIVVGEANRSLSRYKRFVSRRGSKNTLTSSSSCKLLGGSCVNVTDFRGTLLRLFREAVPEILALHERPAPACSGYPISSYWCGKHVGLVRNPHRNLAGQHVASNSSLLDSRLGRSRIRPFLSGRDEAVLKHMSQDAFALYRAHGHHSGLMTHLESRGHAAAELVEGLTIELLPFQQQALQWATERELSPGGVQSFLSPQLPHVEEFPGQDLYFHPILGTISKNKPKLVRGGILAQNMGMGKTVICLSLILKNPAPGLPVSGSPASDIPKQPPSASAFWDPDYGFDTDDADTEVDLKPSPSNVPTKPLVNPKRGSILSRGTLVVVSKQYLVRNLPLSHL